MTRRPSARARVAVIAGASTLLIGTGVAGAAWLAQGTGQTTARSVTAVDLTVTGVTPTPNLYPLPAAGAYPADLSPRPGTLYVTVVNPNPYPVVLSSVQVAAPTITPATGRTCAAGNIAPTAPTPVALSAPVTLAAQETRPSLEIPGALVMLASAPDGCQGATVAVTVTLSGTQA